MMDDEIAMTDMIGGIKASYALEGCIFWILSAKLLMPVNLKEVYYSEDLLLDGSFLFAFKIYSLDMILAVFYFRTQLKKEVMHRRCTTPNENALYSGQRDPGGRATDTVM